MERVFKDVRFAARSLTKSPGYAVVAIVILAIGVGVNTALFSIANGVLFRPLPFPQPKQLVTLHLGKQNFEFGAIPYPTFQDWQRQNRSFSYMALSRASSDTLIGAGEAEYVRLNLITSDFFRVLGVQPLLGRDFAPGEDALGGPALVQISEGLWKRKFGASPDVLGRTLDLGGKSYTIIGVVPSTFDLELGYFSPTDIYLPLGQWGNNALKSRRAALGLHGIGRLKPGVDLEQARADMSAVSRDLAEKYPESNRDTLAKLVPLSDSISGRYQPILLLLLGAVGFVLLIACANVAGLALSRAQAQNREFAIRAALGASRGRLISQVLTESLLLAAIGGGIGLLLAATGMRTVLSLLPLTLPRTAEIHIDARVLLFSILASLLAGILFGLAPALRAGSEHFGSSLRSSGQRVTQDHHRLQTTLVVSEVAIALVLLIGAGLMLRSLWRLFDVDPGFETRNLLMLNVNLSPQLADRGPGATRAYYQQLYERLASVPGVDSVAFYGGSIPFLGEDDFTFWIAGQPQPESDSQRNWALRYIVQPEYLRVMGIPLLKGRFFNESDTEKTSPVIVVDDIFASKFFPKGDAIGKRIRRGPGPGDEAEIIGIVGHAMQWGLDSDVRNPLRAQVYDDFNQLPDGELALTVPIVLRTKGAPMELVQTLNKTISEMNPENVVYGATTMENVISRSLGARRFSLALLAIFAGLALLLAIIGIYGVFSYLVRLRTQEFGIRLALGAQSTEIRTMVLLQAGYVCAIGIGIGLMSAAILTQAMSKLLFEIKPTDLATYAAVTVLVALTSLAASYIPARRATNVDPMVALRYE
jgi:predicted permease